MFTMIFDKIKKFIKDYFLCLMVITFAIMICLIFCVFILFLPFVNLFGLDDKLESIFNEVLEK